ncbi:DNA-dependent RNA polymerase I subunit A43 [Purpureocillium lavendulum]|uniref:DNA-directed RNA polymerase subunit n=1 Tax=Purpureocillium lavendulum TaxID=1247861 RepID=A0AB34FFY8_9HYPO|nr:DNA-dependent RNA polymerase I subunit A43 [Purpureocillium lavendulum]
MPAAMSPEPAKADKKHKRDKSEKKKKRAREDDDVAAPEDAERKHKKSKSIAAADAVDVDAEAHLSKKDKKKKDKKSKHAHEPVEPEEEAPAAEGAKAEKKKHKKKKHREEAGDEAPAADEQPAKTEEDAEKKHKKKKKSKKHADESAIADAAPTDPDAMDVDQPQAAAASSSTSQPTASSNVYSPPDMPANPRFPFFSQTVSLYEPLYPQGWAQPVTNSKYQHLQHLQNKYVPSLRGVLLDYKNVAIGPEPGRDDAATDDDTPTTVLSQREYAVGFGWITADVELFVPSRGAWMEGSVNLQTEGHIGVVCFGRFNASVEARRLPPSWRWVSNESLEAHGFEETASVITADDHGVVRQVHSTGFWVDGQGERVKGKVRFRIRNFDAGTSGETSYLSLEGTMLDRDSEKKLVKEEARTALMRKEKRVGGRAVERRRAPDFAMTRFAPEGGDEEAQKQQEQEQESEEPKPEPWTVSRAQSEEMD